MMDKITAVKAVYDADPDALFGSDPDATVGIDIEGSVSNLERLITEALQKQYGPAVTVEVVGRPGGGNCSVGIERDPRDPAPLDAYSEMLHLNGTVEDIWSRFDEWVTA